MKKILIISFMLIMLASCAIIRPGEVGMKQRIGKIQPNVTKSGMMVFNPFISKVIKIPVRTINREVTIDLPSKEGLTIRSQISILYRIKANMAQKVIEEIGLNYDLIITSVFRSAASDVCANFYAKDMHSGFRDSIERKVAMKMNHILGDKGFEIEAVLLKSIILPPGLARAIEEKLEAEQQAQRMEFVLQTERKEAERKLIEAEGTRDAQKTISEGLTDQILQLRSIEALREFAKSNNMKLIITDGKTPVFLTPQTN
jgi:prohibitin 1